MATTLRDTTRDTAVSKGGMPGSFLTNRGDLNSRQRRLAEITLQFNQQGARVGGPPSAALQRATEARANALAGRPQRPVRPDGVVAVSTGNPLMRWGAEQPAASTQSNNLSRGDEANDLAVRDWVSPLRRPGFMVHNDEFDSHADPALSPSDFPASHLTFLRDPICRVAAESMRGLAQAD
jgi:hypothetical protein